MSFLTGSFLFALAAAGGPTIIHLLNRRRHRTVQWAAMDFLREAVRRNKKIMELRDILLLILRTLAIILFVLAMAQPFWVSEGSSAYRGEPVHAVIVIDNSLSMGYAELDRTLLDEAKDKARVFIDALPKGSDISIIPLCGQDDWHVRDVDATAADALDTLERITVVDREARAADGLEAAIRSTQQASHIPTKRVVVISDMQRSSWSAESTRDAFETLGDVQIAAVAPTDARRRANAWVADFALRDGVADTESTAYFIAEIRHTGERPSGPAEVVLTIDGVVRGRQKVELEDGASKRLEFKHRFDRAGTSAEPLFTRARLELDVKEPLTDDNFREIIVPVVAQVPVVFIDQLGPAEQPDINRFGETHRLREGFGAAGATSDPNYKPLVTVRHRAADQVTREDLAEARLVVMAGVRQPSAELVTTLRQYVEQGGQLLLAAGGDFDPLAWTQSAWRDGAGILPAPLKAEPIGKVPPPTATADQDYPKFHLDAESISREAADLRRDETERNELLSEPFFYKAVAIDDAMLEGFAEAEAERIEEHRARRAAFDADERRWAQKQRAGELTQTEAAQREQARVALREIEPDWLRWSNPFALDDASYAIDQLVARTQPVILGKYDNGEAFVIRRLIGKGRVMFLTSGVFPQWNNMAATYSVLYLDQMMRDLLMRSLPSRNFDAVSVIQMPVRPQDQAASFELLSPGDDEPTPLRVDPLGEDQYGLRVRTLGQRGIYEVSRLGDEANAWSMLLAVNGPSDESDLASYDESEFLDRFAAEHVRWVAMGEAISLEGDTLISYDFWKALIWAVIICLVAEMAFLAAPYFTRMKQQQPAEAGGVA